MIKSYDPLVNQNFPVSRNANLTTHLHIFKQPFYLKNLKRKIEGIYAMSKGDFCKVTVLKKIIKPPLLHIPEVAENSKMLILFFPLILVLNNPFLRVGRPWSLSADIVIHRAATGSPMPEHNLSEFHFMDNLT